MENRSIKREQYETAALTLLMDEHAQCDGNRLLREFNCAQAKGDAVPMPEMMDKKCQKRIRKALRREQSRVFFRKVSPIASKVAVFAFAVILVSAVTILAADAGGLIWETESPWAGYFISDHEDSITVHFGFSEKTKQQDADTISQIMAEYIPEGYTRAVEYSTYAWDSTAGIYSMYKDEAGNMVKLSTRSPKVGLVKVYKEGAAVTEISYLGNEMVLLERDSSRQVLWMDAEEGLYYSLYADALSEEEFWDLVFELLES